MKKKNGWGKRGVPLSRPDDWKRYKTRVNVFASINIHGFFYYKLTKENGNAVFFSKEIIKNSN
jgi:hypothetical protein